MARRWRIIGTVVTLIIFFRPLIAVIDFTVTILHLPAKVQEVASAANSWLQSTEPLYSVVATLVGAILIWSIWMSEEQRSRLKRTILGTTGVRFLGDCQQGDVDG